MSDYTTNYTNKATIFDNGDTISGHHVKSLYDELGAAPSDVHSTVADRLNAMNQLETYYDGSEISFRVSRPSFGITDAGDVYFAPTANDLTAGEEAVIQLGTDGVLTFVRFDEIV